MGADETQDHSKRIIRWIEDRNLELFTKRDLHQGVKGTLKRTSEFEQPEDLSPFEANLHPSEVGPTTRALSDIALMLLNANEFLYVY